MKFTQYAAVAAFAGLANAQSACLSSVLAIPTCALGYIASYAHEQLGCGLVDFNCYCSSANFASITANALPAASSGVNGGCDTSAAMASGSALCACASSNSASPALTLEPSATSCGDLAASIQPCALGIIIEGAAGFGCAFNDLNCQCKQFNSIEQKYAGPIVQTCGSDGTNAIAEANSLCSCVSANPDTGASPTSSAGGSGGNGPTSSAGTSGGSGPTSAPMTRGTSGGSSPTTSAGGSGTTGNGTTTSAPGVSKQTSVSVPQFTNAGATATALGGVVGLVAGLVALL